MKEPRQRLVRWALEISEYDINIVNQPGKENTNADALSQIDENNIIRQIKETKVSQRIIKDQRGDEKLRGIIDYLQLGQLPKIGGEKIVTEASGYEIIEGILSIGKCQKID